MKKVDDALHLGLLGGVITCWHLVQGIVWSELCWASPVASHLVCVTLAVGSGIRMKFEPWLSHRLSVPGV